MFTCCWGNTDMSGRTTATTCPSLFYPHHNFSNRRHQYFNPSCEDLTVSGEFAASSLNPNRFAVNDEVTGDATKFSANFVPANVKVAGASIGSFNFSLSDRYTNKNFSPLDRIDDVEFGRKWSIDSTVTIQPSSEEIREAALTYNPIRALSLGGSIGSNDMGNQFSANRKEGFVRLADDSLPKISYTIEQIKSSQGIANEENDWVRQEGSVSYAMKKFIPSFRFEHEDRSIETPVMDSLDNASFGFTTLAPKFSFKGIYGMNLSTELELRDDDAAYEGKLQPQSRSITQTYDWSLPEVQNISSSSTSFLAIKRFITNSGLPTATSKQRLCAPKRDTRHFSEGLMLMYSMRRRRNGRQSFSAFSSKSSRAKDSISGREPEYGRY